MYYILCKYILNTIIYFFLSLCWKPSIGDNEFMQHMYIHDLKIGDNGLCKQPAVCQVTSISLLVHVHLSPYIYINHAHITMTL